MRLFIPVLMGVFLISCSESFLHSDPKDFNSSISARKDLQTEEELIKAYYNFPEAEGPQSIIISTIKNKDHHSEITLIHDNMQDDSQRALKIIMVAEKTKDGWYIHKIKRNWKCWPGRGHEDWGTEYCN